MRRGELRLRLPATSANLGPAFDAAGLAMGLWLEVEAGVAGQDAIYATGRDFAVAGRLEGNLILETYRSLVPAGPRLWLGVRNGIPLGMGCGSSAAALLAGVLLANHFGALGWTPAQVLEEACRREGHPDNVAACFHGGFTVSAMEAGGQVETASFGAGLDWRLLLALPREGLRTEVARGLLPAGYSREEAVGNVQSTALLVAAFAQGRPELLRTGTRDRMHQPFRMERCPLLGRLLPLAGRDGIWSVTLSGAGPAVLLLADPTAEPEGLRRLVSGVCGELLAEVIETRVAGGMVVERLAI